MPCSLMTWSPGCSSLVWRGCGQSTGARLSQVALLPELLLQDVPVLVEAAVDASHLPVLTHPQLPAHQADQTLVMGNQDDPALKRDSTGERLCRCRREGRRRRRRTLNLLRALARASMVSMSRWLVGSSKT